MEKMRYSLLICLLAVILASGNMASVLLPRRPLPLFVGEGGSYYAWSSVEFPILSEAKLGAGFLILQPLGLALPHYTDSSKIGYVTKGGGRIGILLPGESAEKVIRVNEGDLIPLPLAATSWWFNDGNTEFTVLFLGETSKACHPGDFTYFFLAGTMGMLNGFSIGLVASASGLSQEEAQKVVKSQTGSLIVKLNEEQSMPQPYKDGANNLVYNTEAAVPNVNVENGGRLVLVTSEEFGLLKQAELSGAVVKLDKDATYAPQYSSDSAFQVSYIVKGSGRVQVAGVGGQNVLDEVVNAGELFVVPRFFVVSVVAGGQGMEMFSMFTMDKPVFGQLAGKTSVWEALSPEIVQAALNIAPEVEQSFRSKMKMRDIISPGPK